MTLDRGSRDTTGTIAGFCPVRPPLLLPRRISFLLQRRGNLPSAPSRPLSSLLLFPPPFLSSLERRQVGVRAAVNSPAPLSTLMSLLLFALLNAIRAYSVSLPSLLGPRATTVVLSTSPHKRGGSRTDALAHVHARPRGPRSSPRLFRAHADSATGTRTRMQHADAHGRARNARYRAGGNGGGIAISHRHASAHYCVISRTKTLP